MCQQAEQQPSYSSLTRHEGSAVYDAQSLGKPLQAVTYRPKLKRAYWIFQVCSILQAKQQQSCIKAAASASHMNLLLFMSCTMFVGPCAFCQVSPEVQKSTLEFQITQHPAGKAAAQLQQEAFKAKGQQGMALRQRIMNLEDQAAGRASFRTF